jgi:heptosyltransferase I
MSGLLLHLRRCFPNAEIHLFHGPTNGSAVQLLPVGVISHRCVFTSPLETLQCLRNAKLDLLINSAPWTRLPALLTALSGAQATVGFQSAGQYIHPAFDIAVPYLSNRHEVENHRAVASLFGPMPEYALKLKTIAQAPTIQIHGDRLLLMHMSAGGSAAKQKSWPAENWIALARRLVEKNWTIGFTGAEADRDAVAMLMNQAALPRDRCISLAGRLNMAELCHVMMRARLLITIDTGVAHLAGALNVPVVGLHGPTRFERWGSYSAHATGLNSPHPASGYINYGFESHPEGDEIMASLTVDSVFDAITKKLDESADASSNAIQVGGVGR